MAVDFSSMRLMPVIILAMMPFFQMAAQKPIWVPERVLDSLARVAQNPDSALEFTATELRADSIRAEDGMREFHFGYSNISGRPVRILRAVPSCGCIGVRFDTGEIRPGETGEIIARFNPGRHIGSFSYKIQVYVEGLKTPANMLVLRGSVIPAGGYPDYPVQMGELRLTRRSVTFGEVSMGSVRQERIACVNTGDKSLHVKAFAPMLPQGISLATEPEVIPPQGEADIVITLRPSGLPVSMAESGKSMVLIDGVDAKPSEKSIEIEFTIKDN